ncbi:hypothetical protein [Cytobacillus gottheilii]|uniref:hypothetical protein n=1 Tax=Cytobacillus gottheilii TaxID=859144 RepID=UPI00082E8534|nr:hypothetical protein [Cytobacillus gottheilii]
MINYIIVLLVLLIIGFSLIVRVGRTQSKNLEEAYEYLNKFREYGNSLIKDNEDYQVYEWLTMRGPKMQAKVGELGIAKGFIPPFSNIQYNTYQIIVNALPTLRDEARDPMRSYNSLQNKIVHNYLTMIDDVLLRYIGRLENRLEDVRTQLKNPFIWLREGVQFFVQIPILLLYWSGLIKYTTYYRFSNNFIIKFINFLIILIGLGSSIITIVTGYNPFMEIFNNM